MKNIHIGTSGWSYKHWKGIFYPEEIPERKWLGYYTNQFETVELNSSFYHLPKEKTVAGWRENTPGNFLFSCKASRYITHIKKLRDPAESLKKLFDAISGLKEKTGAVLFQLPPDLGYDMDRLMNFTDALPPGYKYTFEFRHPGWWRDETYRFLEKKNIAFCIYELGKVLTPRITTGNTVYIRLHGPGKKYKGNYDAGTINFWSDLFVRWADEGKEIFCYFDNDEKGYAVRNALELKEKVRVHVQGQVQDQVQDQGRGANTG